MDLEPDPTLAPEQCRPTGLDLELGRQQLRVQWADGVTSVFDRALLRRQCPCAECRTARQQSRRAAADPLAVLTPAQQSADEAQITGGRVVGNYAVQIEFSDGHDTGIYDFRLLRTMWEELGAK